MARNDGVDRTIVRNHDLKAPSDVAKIQEHNEREKTRYSNQDIVPERTAMNVHFKASTASYTEMFDQLEREKVISTRGLKPDAVKFGELVFDVNSAYFYNHGGYEFAKQFYADAYKAAVEIVGGEQYILSAVMHADERNRAMSEALGEDVYHYHLHVVYIPVVEKQVLWSKRCKDKSLVGTVKETLMQVSRSKKWASKPALDADGKPMLNAKGKTILKSSYSVLQDDFFNFMRSAGYNDIERGERGSTEEHLTVTQFKVKAEQQRLEAMSEQVAQAEQALEKQEHKLDALKKETKAAKAAALTAREIKAMGKRNPLTGSVTLTAQECSELKKHAVNGLSARAEIVKLRDKLSAAEQAAAVWKRRFDVLHEKYEALKKKSQPYLAALEAAPEKVRAFISDILARARGEQERKQPHREHGRDTEL
ncbi:MAG TPA: plasmid recombination protein [Candidatus Scatomorpha pullicola]|nr:plasmid recombination protein [Candidatus Scatomorpha pullicola]